jgi:Fe-Mn family superoxide dismutase
MDDLDASSNMLGGGVLSMAHELKPLPYGYDALEPFLDEETLRLHHDKHHAAYVNNLNAAEEKVQAALKSGDFAAARALSGDLAFNGSGAILHSIFWSNMKPGGGGEPSGELLEMIQKHFGSYESFKGLFLATTNSIQGSGWGILAYRNEDNALVVLGAEKHENLAQWGVQPILVLDVWEHAYYLKYQNKRPEWTKAFIEHLVNWDDAARRLKHAKG